MDDIILPGGDVAPYRGGGLSRYTDAPKLGRRQRKALETTRQHDYLARTAREIAREAAADELEYDAQVSAHLAELTGRLTVTGIAVSGAVIASYKAQEERSPEFAPLLANLVATQVQVTQALIEGFARRNGAQVNHLRRLP